jgi:2-furoyl-CoA dehydrogenase FAD binding subunit
VKPAPFDYARAGDAAEAAALLAEYGDEARILAGGQSLMAVLNMRLAQPALLVDISRSTALAGVRVVDGALEVSAAATQASVEWREGLARELPLLAQAFPHISHYPVRNRGTVCGSIAHADPSAELPLCLLALRGEVRLRSARRHRTLAAEAFFTGMLSTARAADELVESVRFPLAAPGAGHAFEEFSHRHGDFAVCAVAAVARADGLRVAVGGVADRPVARDWPLLGGDALDDALNEFAWALDARDDPHVPAATRRHLVRRLGRRAVERARRAANLAMPA